MALALLYAAGSLREAFDALIVGYRDRSGVDFHASYGPSGLLRERIERGEAPDVFASASIAHTDALVRSGQLRESLPFARNRLCVLARPGVALAADRLLDILLDPQVRIGTSTPGTDPSGDYTWEFFRNAERAHPGAFSALDAKSKKLAGREVDPRQQEAPYAQILLQGRVDVFITYRSNAVVASKVDARLTHAPLPAELDVDAVYGIGAATRASTGTAAFLPYARSAEARAVLACHGFDDVDATARSPRS